MKKPLYLLLAFILLPLLSGCIINTGDNPEAAKKQETECTSKFDFKYTIGGRYLDVRAFDDEPAIGIAAKNISGKTISYAEIRVSCFDADGAFIENHYLYYMGTLKPDEATSLYISGYDKRCKTCTFVVSECN